MESAVYEINVLVKRVIKLIQKNSLVNKKSHHMTALFYYYNLLDEPVLFSSFLFSISFFTSLGMAISILPFAFL